MEKSKHCQLRVTQLSRGRYQPRESFDPLALEELTQSIRTHGIIQPIIVRSISQDNFEIIAGERRWRAAQLAGLEEVPCLVRPCSDEEAAAIATLENVNRKDLNPIEEAQGYMRMHKEFGYTQEEIAAAIGKTRTAITNSLRLLKLHPTIQAWLKENQLTEGHGKTLAGLSERTQLLFAQKVIEKQWSVRQLENEIRNYQKPSITPEKQERNPNIAALENRIAAKIGCPSRVDFSSGKGELKIQFYDLEVLQGILEKLGVTEDEQY